MFSSHRLFATGHWAARRGIVGGLRSVREEIHTADDGQPSRTVHLEAHERRSGFRRAPR